MNLHNIYRQETINSEILKKFQTEKDIQNLNIFNEHESARIIVSKRQKKYITIGLLITLASIISSPIMAIYSIFIIINLVYFMDTFFKIILFLSSLFKTTKLNYEFINDEELPVYTILLPLYKETKILKNLNYNIANIDYPAEKMDIILLLEEHDTETIKAAKEYFTMPHLMLIIPPIGSKTKPKAMQIGMQYAKGEFITVYDAEDQPDPLQLKKAVYAFKADKNKEYACLQSKLNMTNYKDGIIPMFFSFEYNIWFNNYLQGIYNLELPIPLGGTSNHFRTDILKTISGWDPYNVTEDADLGIRIYKSGLKTGILDSTTDEIAPKNIVIWLGQRSRWIKGYYQTFLVHNRNISYNIRKNGIAKYLGFNLFITVQVLTFTISLPLIIIATLLHFTNALEPIKDIVQLNVLLNYITHVIFALNIYYVKKYKYKPLRCLIYPFYFVMHSIASLRALKELLFKPYYWFRTPH